VCDLSRRLLQDLVESEGVGSVLAMVMVRFVVRADVGELAGEVELSHVDEVMRLVKKEEQEQVGRS
jgi:hypothetical protein